MNGFLKRLFYSGPLSNATIVSDQDFCSALAEELKGSESVEIRKKKKVTDQDENSLDWVTYVSLSLAVYSVVFDPLYPKIKKALQRSTPKTIEIRTRGTRVRFDLSRFASTDVAIEVIARHLEEVHGGQEPK